MTKTLEPKTEYSDLIDQDIELIEHGIVFENDIPLPKRIHRPGRHAILEKALKAMEVGSSFIYETSSNTVKYYADKAGVNVVIRDIEGKCAHQGKQHKLRIWRTA